MTLYLPNLSVLAYANNFTLWHYKTEDIDIFSDGYFNNAADMMNIGDLIYVTIKTDDGVSTSNIIVSELSSGKVKVREQN